MATRDEEDVRSRNTRRTQQPRNRDYRTVRRMSQPSNTSANAGALALTLGTAAEAAPTLGQIARGVISGVGAGLGSMSGMAALPALTIGSIPLMVGYEMSGKGRPTGIVTNNSTENGRYIAQPDATTVTLRPSPAADYLYSSSKKTKNKGNDQTALDPEPDLVPVDVSAGDEDPIFVAGSDQSTQTGTRTGTQIGQTTAPVTPEPENNNKKRKLPESIRKIGTNLGKFYGKVGTAAAYTIGVGLPVGGLGYGVYKLLEPEKTSMDSTIEALYKQAEDYGKLNTILDQQARLDSLRNALQNRIDNRNNQQPTLSIDTVSPVAEQDTLKLW